MVSIFRKLNISRQTALVVFALAFFFIGLPVFSGGLGEADHSGSFTSGNVNSDIVFELFTDYQCPRCKNFHENNESQFISQIIDGLALGYVVTPVAFLGSESVTTGTAAISAMQQDSFLEFQEALYTAQQTPNQGTFSNEFVLSLAASVGMDEREVTKAFRKYDSVVESNTSRAKALGVDGIPKFIVSYSIGDQRYFEVISANQPVEFYIELVETIRELQSK